MKVDLLLGEAIRSVAARRVAAALAGIGILAASAWLSVPFYPVPLTMQTLAVLLVGGMLGPVSGASAVAGYLALGAMGAPVFHNGLGGILVLAGPTGGYLVGFLPAAFLMGWAVRLTRSRWPVGSLRQERWEQRGRSAAAARVAGGSGLSGPRGGSGQAVKQLALLAGGALLASVAIYAFGLPWLAIVARLSVEKTVAVGLVPFLLGDTLKAAVAIGAIYLGGRALSGRSWSLF
jgi:biotin transport system substrate-specific component